MRRLAFWALVGLQALVPLTLIGWNEARLALGDEVRLRTVPVDPVDLFRGRYVDLRYEISRGPIVGAQRGDVVYVPLREEGRVWVAAGPATPHRPEGRFIRGRVVGSTIEYGIETYYADEDEARELEGRAGELVVVVVLDDSGRARIAGIEAVR